MEKDVRDAWMSSSPELTLRRTSSPYTWSRLASVPGFGRQESPAPVVRESWLLSYKDARAPRKA